MDEQETHLTSLVILHVCPMEQHPCDGLGSKEKLALHVVHWFALLHRSQLRLDGHTTHPTPAVALNVYPALQSAHMLSASHLIQFNEEGHKTHLWVVILIEFPAG